ncbi:MAG: hypothetical protein NUV91_04705 [Candidatus Omnitrophica bacterium]|nr:hypothetical protein [Candidatus Omnitrophota bacterium]
MDITRNFSRKGFDPSAAPLRKSQRDFLRLTFSCGGINPFLKIMGGFIAGLKTVPARPARYAA